MSSGGKARKTGGGKAPASRNAIILSWLLRVFQRQ